MIRSLLIRGLAAVCSLVFLAQPALADLGKFGAPSRGLRLDRPRHFVDRDCTDNFSTPATTVNVNLTTLTNWDTWAEAINPDRNLNDATQTGGSADGWCDTEPWKIKGSFTAGASSTVYIGPLIVDPNGFYLSWYFPTIVTSYQLGFAYSIDAVTTTLRPLGYTAALTGTTLVGAEVTPVQASGASAISSQYTAMDNFFWPAGRPIYMSVTMTGAGAFAFDLETTPILHAGRKE